MKIQVHKGKSYDMVVVLRELHEAIDEDTIAQAKQLALHFDHTYDRTEMVFTAIKSKSVAIRALFEDGN